MTANQIAYNRLLEEKRSNLRNEELTNFSNQSGRMQAQAALSQAQSAKQNADTNLLNAQTNVSNAETNARNAATNERNAATNELNATANMIKAKAEEMASAFNNALTRAKTASERQIATKLAREADKVHYEIKRLKSQEDLDRAEITLRQLERIMKEYDVYVHTYTDPDFMAGVETGRKILDAIVPKLINVGKH